MTWTPVTDGYPIPDPMILGYTRSVPDIFSESSGILGIGYYRKVGFCHEADIIFRRIYFQDIAHRKNASKLLTFLPLEL